MFSFQYDYWHYNLNLYQNDSKEMSKYKKKLFFINNENR